jgi:hypothetical protein
MAYAIGSLLKAGGDDTHYQFLALIKTVAEANGWVTLRYDTVSANRELILQGEGLSGTEEIFIGFRTYQNSGADYYNLVSAVFTGYLPGNTFDLQPGVKLSGIPAHNNAIDYFLSVNAQRIVFCLKVGTPVYVHGYAGKGFPAALPSEFPTMLVVAGMFYSGVPATRFSDTNYQFPYGGRILGTGSTSGGAMWMRDFDGNWTQKYVYPFSNGNSRTGAAYGNATSNSNRCFIPAGNNYNPEQILLHDSSGSTTPSNIWGWLDGVYFISGFNNGVENVAQMGGSSVVDQTGMTVLQAVDAILAVGGRAFVVLQNVTRTTFSDYIALEMVA